MEAMVHATKAVCDVLCTTRHKQQDGEGTSSEATSWFDDLELSLQPEDQLLNNEKKQNPMVPRLLQLLRESLVTQRNNSAASVLEKISSVPHKIPDVLWKSSLELYYRDPVVHGTLIDQLVNVFKWLAELNAKDVTLEYAMYLLNSGRIEDARQALQELPTTSKKSDREVQDIKFMYTSVMYKAYDGLVWYVQWLAAKTETSHLDPNAEESLSLLSTISFSQNKEERMSYYATKAMACFDELIGEDGVWDIFITKHIELLEYYNRSEKARDLLLKYRDRNMENPNSHKYLYNFLCQRSAPNTEKIDVLKVLAVRVPSDSLVLELCHLLIGENEVESAIEFLFCLLDYKIWMWKVKAWEMLACLLHDLFIRSSPTDVIKECWEVRSSWWPAYHFNIRAKCPNSSDSGCHICLCKAKCSLHLIGRGCVYAEVMRKHLNEKQLEELDEEKESLTAIT